MRYATGENPNKYDKIAVGRLNNNICFFKVSTKFAIVMVLKRLGICVFITDVITSPESITFRSVSSFAFSGKVIFVYRGSR